MPGEYELSLRLAIEALGCISDADRRHAINETLSELLAEEMR